MLPVIETVRNDGAKPLEVWLDEVGASDMLITALNLIPGAAFIVDRNRDVLFWSRGAELLLGFSATEVVGQHCLKSNRCARCIEGCGVAEHGVIQDAPLSLFNQQGEQVAVHKHAQAFYRDGVFVGAIEIMLPVVSATENVNGESPSVERTQVGAEASLPVLKTSAKTSVTTPTNSSLVPPHSQNATTAVHVSETFHGIITADAEMQRLLKIVRDVARSDVSALIRGESGTGKELVAAALHTESHRKDGPFIAVNCAAQPPMLLESELFGHERGAFTGAIRKHLGVFERAHGGTLFLDEVGELPLELQAKLLRVLQERSFTRVGGSKSIDVDVRIVSATNRSLRRAASVGEFRDDLLYRLRVVPLHIPALRARRADIPLLVDHILKQIHGSRGEGPRRVTNQAMRVLLVHSWPGNVRELINVLQYASVVTSAPVIEVSDLPPEFREDSSEHGATISGRYRAPRTDDEERVAIEKALADAGGHIGQAASALGMSRPTLWRRRKRFGI